MAQCTLGVGCDEYGVCFALANDQPWQCGKDDHANTWVEQFVIPIMEYDIQRRFDRCCHGKR